MMKCEFGKNDSFRKVFKDEHIAPLAEVHFPSRVLRGLLGIYPLRTSRMLLRMDADTLTHTLNILKKRVADGDGFYVPLGETGGIYRFVIGGGKPFMLIVPGGGYESVCTLNEGFATAIAVNAIGYNAFVCRYRVGKDAKFPAPQEDIAEALKRIKQDAEAMDIAADGYAVCGFSAGGHLAASWGTKQLGYVHYGMEKPAAIILGYPVITMGKYTHSNSRKRHLGDEAGDEDVRRAHSVEELVDGDYPDTFLWACRKDACVSFRNTLLMKGALERHGCRFEFLSYGGSAHGWGSGIGTPAEGWLERAVAFWQRESAEQ